MLEITAHQKQELETLLERERIATLAVLGSSGAPLTALVAYAWDQANGGILIHLSSLSAHQRALLSHPECSLLVHEQDDGRGQPLLLQRALATRARERDRSQRT